MTFNSDGKLARFYLFFDTNSQLPQDLCAYFWGLVGCVLGILFFGGLILISFVAVTIYAAVWIWAHKKGASLGLGGIALFALCMWLSERKIKVEILTEVKTIIKGKINAVKGRYCPRIEWR